MQLDPKALIEEAVQASIDAGLAVNGEYGVAAARHAARFMLKTLQAVQPVPVIYADLVNDQMEAKLRKIIRPILKHHGIVNGVLEADLTSAIKPLTATASAEPVVTEDAHQFKNFHRLLCERFGYCHDEKDWRRDQVSLIEHIAALTEERDRLKQWQADQVEVIDEAKALITELNADKKALEAERDRLALANAELKPLLQNIGDGIANMFDQLVKGNWRDDHDHDVKMNVHMLNLQDVLKQIMRFRADYLDYSEPNFDKHKATSTEGK